MCRAAWAATCPCRGPSAASSGRCPCQVRAPLQHPVRASRAGVVAGDAEQGMYVWIDALSNYLTVCGFPHDQAKAQACWPAAVHVRASPSASALAAALTAQRPSAPARAQVVGKDITRFHCVYWPAFLLGAGLPLPKLVLAHSHWTAERRKMSKSVGNVVDPAQLLQQVRARLPRHLARRLSGGAPWPQYGCDSVRYYLLRDGGMADDVDFSTDALAARVDADMVNTLGNLGARALAMAARGGRARVLMRPRRSLSLHRARADAGRVLGAADPWAAIGGGGGVCGAGAAAARAGHGGV